MSGLAIWEAATTPDVQVERVPWPELATLTQAARGLRTFDGAVVVRVAAAVWAARRTLVSSPLPPNDPAVELRAVIEDIGTFIDDHPTHAAAGALRAVRDAANVLLGGPSPLSTWAVDILSSFGAQPDGTPEAVLVVPRERLTDPTTAWLTSEELTCVDVATPALLRDGCNHRAALVLGHPAITYSTPFAPPVSAARQIGWLLTAPPAQKVHLALLADDPPLTEAEVWTWPDETAHPRWRLSVPARTSATVVQTEWFTDVPAVARDAVRPHGMSEDDVLATAVITASGHTIYFSADAGAQPRFLGVEDTGDITISTATITQLTPGRVLVEHTSGAAREALNTRANQWLTEKKHWTAARIAAAREGSQAVKWIVLYREIQVGKDVLVDDLVRTGLERSYASGMVERVLNDEYIAPRTKGLDAILRVGDHLNWDDPVPQPREWLAVAHAARDDLSTLRAAHQHAGDMIHRDLRARLRNRAWEDDVTVKGWASVNDPTLGDVLLTTVVAIDGIRPVPRSWLGVPKGREDR